MPFWIPPIVRHRLSILITAVVLSLLGCTDAAAPKQTLLASPATIVENPLWQADETLHQQLLAVQQADDAYAQLLTQRTTTKELDEKDGRIVAAEMALQQTIDSLEKNTALNGEAKDRLTHLTAYYKNALQNRRAASDMRMVLSANSDDSTAAQQMVLRLRSELREKDKRIAALQQEARQSSAVTLLQNPPPKKQAGTYAPARGETDAELKQRNKNLYLALSDLQNKYFVLGRNYLVLKQEHERTLNEVAVLRKLSTKK